MRVKRKNLALAIVVSAIAIFVPSFLLGKYIEGIVFFVCHWLIREQFPAQYHHVIPAMCRLITGCVFFFGTSFILPFSLSLFSAIPINYVIAWVGYTKNREDYYVALCARLQEKYCNEKEKIIANCRSARLSQRDTEIAIKYFYEKNTPKEIWLWLCNHKMYDPIEWDSLYTIIYRIGKKINENK